jgi:hypothetical protein
MMKPFKEEESETEILFGKLKTILTVKIALKQMNTSKLASRKLWVTVGGSVLITISTFLLLSMNVPEEITTELVSWTAKIVLGYAGVQGIVDVADSIQAGKKLASKVSE